MCTDGGAARLASTPPVSRKSGFSNAFSDAVAELAKGQPFAAGCYDDEAGRRFSLRSDPNGFDVSAIAASYGGGGHRSATGFFAPRGWEGDRRPFIEWERPRNKAGADLARAEVTD
jgi:hypothetical protein